ncbi:hypothetical protein [Bacillus sp. M6-12]|uniref:hypothetical protein n=1 Tax=Bacillus sp. M6-12 TaxID=2054166 RepID=UPI0015E071E9|nr:hypothetical protein [Bacillus sp. M6-12]
MFIKQMNELKRITANLKKQGKSETEIKQAISLYLTESKKKINPNGDLDIV